MIVTFYSYKGGVGRTFCLANIAVLLARWGNRVLCVDWDLEAPGLREYFRPWLPEPPRRGLVDVLHQLRAGSTPSWEDWADVVLPMEVPGTDGLALLPAGDTGDGYVAQMQALDWDELYRDHRLGDHLEWLRDELTGRYDYVLVDSRTGITDIGGICTAQLPDVLVACFAANTQSITGVLDVARRAAAARDALPYDRAGLLTVPLLTRFDAREEYERAAAWRTRIADRTAELLRTWLPKEVPPRDLVEQLTVPYLSYWSFGEEVPAAVERSGSPESVTYSLATVAALLAHRLQGADLLVASRDSYVRAARDPAPRARADGGFDSDLCVVYQQDGAARAEAIADALAGFQLRVARAEVVAPKRIGDAVREARHLALVHLDRRSTRYVRDWRDAGSPAPSPTQLVIQVSTKAAGYTSSLRDYGQDPEQLATEIAEAAARVMIDEPAAPDDPARAVDTLLRVAESAQGAGDSASAERLLRLAARAPGGPRAGPVQALGEVLWEAGRLAEARAVLGQVIDIDADGPEAVVAQAGLGSIAYQQGDTELAERHFRQAAAADGPARSRVMALTGLATIAQEQGDQPGSIDYLQRAKALTGQPQLRVLVLHQLGRTLGEADRPEHAVEALREAAHLAAELGWVDLAAGVEEDLADVYLRQAQQQQQRTPSLLREAVDHLRLAADGYRDHGSREEESRAAGKLADALRELGDQDAARAAEQRTRRARDHDQWSYGWMGPGNRYRRG